MSKGIKHSFLAVLALVLAASVMLAGCGNKSGSGMASKQVLNINLGSEPPSLDPGISQDNTSFTVLWAIFEGLTRLNADGKPEAAVAKSWDVSSDKKTYTFHLRKDVKWSNGDPVTAQDFEFAWKRALDPKLASPYAYQLYYLTGAEAYNTGKSKDPSTIGVKATDDHTLVVHLNAPTPYFVSLCSFVTYMPLDPKVVKSNPKWAADAKTIVSDGPFTIDSWKHNSSLDLKKNPKYYEASKVKLQKVHMVMVSAASTDAQMFETGQLDLSGLPGVSVSTDLIPKLKKEGKLNVKGQAAVYYYEFNNKQKPFDNANIRKAFAMSIDRKAIVTDVTKGGQIPAYGMVTPGIAGDKKTYREEHPDNYFKEDPAKAKQLLQKGMQEEGISKMPPITLIYNTSEGHKKIAQAIADMWKKNLGVDVQIKNMEWKVFLKTRQSLNYQIARAGWIADYNDPNTFLDMFTTHSGNNDTGFSDPTYDNLIKDAAMQTSAKKRMDDFAKAEKILIQDKMVVMPIYYYTSIWRLNPKVKNFNVDWQGNIHFNYAYIAK